MGFLQLLLVSVGFNVTANILLKKGVTSFGGITGDKSTLILELSKAAFSPFIILGLSLYCLSFLIWLRVLSFNDLSRAYPLFASSTFLLTTFGSILFLKEEISFARVFGIAIILIGIFIVARS